MALRQEVELWEAVWQRQVELSPTVRVLTPPMLKLTREAGDRWLLRDTRDLPGVEDHLWLTYRQASLALAAQPFTPTAEIEWALERKLGVALDGWYVPLATADPALIQEFETTGAQREPEANLARPRPEVLLMA
jgi:hypothetical protein